MNLPRLPGPAGRRQAWLGLLLILLALAMLIRQALLSGNMPGDDADAPASAARHSVGGLARAGAAVPASSPQPAAQAAADAASAAVPAGQVEICGFGRVAVDGEGRPLQSELLERPLREARASVLLALADSAEETDRAAGLFLRSTVRPVPLFSPRAVAAAGGEGNEGNVEKSSPQSAQENGQANGQADAAQQSAAREALAGMAARTRSPRVYALALKACAPVGHGPGAEGACSLLSSAQWSRLDPRNAAPWLQAAHDAQARGDTAAAAEAVFHIAQASVNDARAASLVTLAMARVPADAPPFVRAALAAEVMAASRQGSPSSEGLARHCSKEAVADSNRLQACAALSELLTRSGGSVADLAVGAGIGERVGWPAERLQSLRDEREAMEEVSAQAWPQGAGAMGCAVQRRLAQHIAQVGAWGEVGALREFLGQSPEDAATLAPRLRDRRAQQKEAQRAVSPP